MLGLAIADLPPARGLSRRRMGLAHPAPATPGRGIAGLMGGLNMCQAAMVPAHQAPAMPAQGIARGAEAPGSGENPFMQAIGKALGQSLDQATYAGYRVGFEAAREEAALLAELAGQGALAAQLRAMRPLPDKGEKQA
jgi:hypothetical protein